MDEQALQFQIGHGDWISHLRSFTDQFDRKFWDGWKPVTKNELSDCMKTLERTFPEDFQEFLLQVGYGPFLHAGGSLYSPKDIIEGCPGPLWFVLGSSEWASDEDHVRFYQTHGRYNPAPDRFTEAALRRQGYNLLDLLQIGSDGQCCYHQLYVGPEPKPFAYCLLTPEATEEDKLPSFSAALRHILIREQRSALGLDEHFEPGIASDLVIDEDKQTGHL